MTRIVWDKPDERLYHTGIDRGVLFKSDYSGIPWNGLTGASEDFSDDSSELLYLDGVPYGSILDYADYAGTLSAFTFPDEFLAYLGASEFKPGLFFDNQPLSQFHLSYRAYTGTGGSNSYYQIHILYNLIALMADTTYTSLDDSPDPIDFSWTLSAVPEPILNFRPTAHVVVDSRHTKPYILSLIENQLYGTSTTAPVIPRLQDLVNMIQAYSIIYVTDNGDGTATIKGPDNLVYPTADPTVWQIDLANVIATDATSQTFADTKDM